jgi:hypothetical protein
MNNEETRILNPGQKDASMSTEKSTQSEEKRKSGTSKESKAAYAAGGFAAGLAAGSMGSAFVTTAKEQDVHVEDEIPAEVANSSTEDETSQEIPTPQEAIVATSEGVKVAQVSDEVSFSEAFTDARAQVGAGGVFEWHGHVYSTYYEEEWNQMSPADKAEYQAKIDYSAVTDGSDAIHTASNRTHAVHTDIEQTTVESTPTADDTSGNAEVKVLGVEVVQGEDGRPMTIAALEVDGHNSLMVDVDMDGTMDVMAIDVNDNGQIDEGEYGNIQDLNISSVDLAEQAPDTSGTYLAQADDMPDYMNDADVSYMA